MTQRLGYKLLDNFLSILNHSVPDPETSVYKVDGLPHSFHLHLHPLCSQDEIHCEYASYFLILYQNSKLFAFYFLYIITQSSSLYALEMPLLIYSEKLLSREFSLLWGCILDCISLNRWRGTDFCKGWFIHYSISQILDQCPFLPMGFLQSGAPCYGSNHFLLRHVQRKFKFSLLTPVKYLCRLISVATSDPALRNADCQYGLF